jgi:16S rRNA (uracil1498-N3)-methyltransferase
VDKAGGPGHDRLMPATPPWPPRSLPRLFVDQPLEETTTVVLEGPPANYLGNVMRLGEGGEVLLFNGVDGEWLARIGQASKKRMHLTSERKTREQEVVPDIALAFAPVKRAQTDWLVEKSTELGVARLQPVMTRRTIAERVKLDRLRLIAIEAAEQCHRSSLPNIDEPVPLAAFLRDLPSERTLYFADENGGETLTAALRPGRATILVGPEGGFTQEERSAIRASAGAVPISLGPRILRAETAALAALAAWMTLSGDWK